MKSIDYYRLMVIRGIPIHAEMLPQRREETAVRYKKNKNSDDAKVCLTCTKKNCLGTQHCYALRRDELLRMHSHKAAKRKKQGGRTG